MSFAGAQQTDRIKRVITQHGSKWQLNGKSASASKVDAFAKDERNIKVDNLCQFLAQASLRD